MFTVPQAEWREEVKKHFEKIKSEGTCIHRLDEELIRRRRDELRSDHDNMRYRINDLQQTALKLQINIRPFSHPLSHLLLHSQACAGYSGALREEVGEG